MGKRPQYQGFVDKAVDTVDKSPKLLWMFCGQSKDIYNRPSKHIFPAPA